MKFDIDNTSILFINRSVDIIRKIKLIDRFKKLKINNYRKVEAIIGIRLIQENYRYFISSLLDIPIDKLLPEYWLSRKNFTSLSTKRSNVLPRVGCMLSHILCFKRAIYLNYSNLLILEDDAYLTDDILLDDIEIPDDADIIYFGGTYKHVGERLDFDDEKIVKINPSFLKLYGCFGYFIPNRKKIIEIHNFLMSQFKDGKGKKKLKDFSGNERLLAGNIDNIFCNHYQKNGNCYFINKPRIYHNDGGISTLNNNQSRSRYKLKYEY